MSGLAEVTAATYQAVRAQEKNDLGNLNGRLRNYVNLQQRKQQDYKRMIAALGEVEQKYEEQMTGKNYELRMMHERQQALRHSQRALIGAEKNKAVAARLVCDEYYAKNRNLTSDNDRLRARKEEVEADLRDTTNTLNATNAAVQETNAQLQAKTQRVSELNSDLRDQKAQHATLKDRQARVDNQLRDTQEKLNRYVEETDGQIAALRNELVQRREAEQRIEEELRTEYQTKLEEFISQRRLAHQTEKEEWMKIFRDEYARKISAYRNANEDYESQISQLRNDRANLNDKVMDLDVKIDLIKRDIGKFSAERERWNAQVAENNDKIEGLRARLRRKTHDFDAMLKIKENLEGEIKDYWMILSGEERRLGFRQGRGSE